MKRKTTGVLTIVLMVAGIVWAAGEVFSVQVKSAKLRSRPSFLGSVVNTLDYGSEVTVLAKRGPWTKVKGSDSAAGWLHKSALSEDRIVLAASSDAVNTGASSDEVALAGKGFTEEVEAEYKKEHGELDYTWVDRMEKIVVQPQEAERFLAEGKIEPNEGGR